MTIPEFFATHDFSAAVDADALLAEFDRQMDEGLAGRPSSLAMLPAWLGTDKDVPVESPIVVLDAGGTNLRVAVVWFDRAGKARVEDFQKYAMPGTDGSVLAAKEFFAKFAEFLVPVCRRAEAVGFCFSYPTEIFPDLDGRLIRWTKKIEAPEVVGTRVGAGISDALFEATGRRLPLRVLNDTTATLLAGKTAGLSRRHSSYVGFILGTGTNTAYVEDAARIGKIAGSGAAGSMIVNVESGGFDGAPRSDFDRRAARRYGAQQTGLFEKMISGAYIGDVGLEALKAAAEDGLFSPGAAAALLALRDLSTKDFDDFAANPFLRTGALADVPFSEDDRRTLLAVAEPLFLRAAALTAVNVSAAALRTRAGRDPLHPVCITIDGSTYYKTRTAMFKSRVEQGLRDILGPRGVHFETVFVEDAPMIGSAVAGLIA